MSFAGETRLELVERTPEAGCCRLASLAALLILGGRVNFLGQGRYAATISSEHACVVRYADRLARLAADLAGEFAAVRTAQLGERVKYQLTFRDADAVSLIRALGLWDERAPFCVSGKPEASMLRRLCCQRAYLKGAFLACGWIKPPETAYRAELAAPDRAQAEHLARILRKNGVSARISPRKTQHVVYFQEGEMVSTFLKLIGANRSVLRMENARALREVRNSVNRQVNCDARNLEAVVSAAQRQVADILYLKQRGALEKLPPPLKQIAEARLNNTEVSLAELGELLDPPIGKSGVNNRLRRLTAMAEEMRGARGEG